jgi:hypothetical protein
VQLVARNGRRPVLPVRTIGLRFVKRSGRFVPCGEHDRRATVRTQVDAAGRMVESVSELAGTFDGDVVREGWRITAGAYANALGPSPGEVLAHLEQQKIKRRKARK